MCCYMVVIYQVRTIPAEKAALENMVGWYLQVDLLHERSIATPEINFREIPAQGDTDVKN